MLYQIPTFYNQFLHFRCVVQSLSKHHAQRAFFGAILIYLTEMARLPSCSNIQSSLVCREVAVHEPCKRATKASTSKRADLHSKQAFATEQFHKCRAGTVTTGNEFQLTATIPAYVPSTLLHAAYGGLPSDLGHFGA